MSESNAIVNKSFFVESGTYQPVMLRPYETRYDESIAIQYCTDTDGGTKIVPNAFSNMASSIIAPTAAHQGNITIENGWNERRMSFIIEVNIIDSFNALSKVVVLTGYTNHTDVGIRSLAFDPNMRMFINTSTVIQVVQTRTPNGTINDRKTVIDSSHLLNVITMRSIKTQMQQEDMYRDNKLWYATPSNVINEMVNINEGNSGINNFRPNSNFNDFRQTINDTTVSRSRRENTIPTQYLSKILRGVSDGYSNMVQGIDDDERTALINASVGVRESPTTIDPVITMLAVSTDFSINGYVTWNEMCNLLPTLDAVTSYTTRSSNVVRTNTPMAEAGNFQGWGGVTFETTIANAVSQLVPAMMTSCMLGNLTFVFSNDNITGTPTLRPTSGQVMIEGIPFMNMANAFETRFLTEVAPMITDQGRTIINMLVQCSLGTETYINISRNGQPEVPFCAPTFCDALYTPIISQSKQNITNVASDLRNIANSVNSIQYMNNGQHPHAMNY